MDTVLTEVTDYLRQIHVPGVVSEWLALLATEVTRLKDEIDSLVFVCLQKDHKIKLLEEALEEHQDSREKLRVEIKLLEFQKSAKDAHIKYLQETMEDSLKVKDDPQIGLGEK